MKSKLIFVIGFVLLIGMIVLVVSTNMPHLISPADKTLVEPGNEQGGSPNISGVPVPLAYTGEHQTVSDVRVMFWRAWFPLPEMFKAADVVARVKVESISPPRFDTPDGRPPAGWPRNEPVPEGGSSKIYSIYYTVQVRVERYYKGEALARQVEGGEHLTLTGWGGEVEGCQMIFEEGIVWQPGMRGLVLLGHSRTLGGPWSDLDFYEYQGDIAVSLVGLTHTYPQDYQVRMADLEAILTALSTAH